METISAYENLEKISELFDKIDFVTVGRVDFVGSLDKDRSYVDKEEMYKMVEKVFVEARKKGALCYIGGAVSIGSIDFIKKLLEKNLLDKFETRYIIYDAHKIDINELDKLLYWGNVFEVAWLKYINERYSLHANKDVARIKMIEDRISLNKK